MYPCPGIGIAEPRQEFESFDSPPGFLRCIVSGPGSREEEMAVATHNSIGAPWLVPQFEEGASLRLAATSVKDSIPYPASQSPIPQSPSSPSGRISPAVLFIIVILAVVFFISGLLHLLVRLLMKKHPPPSASSAQADGQNGAEISGPDALQRQLQQLFHLHDSGLDQAFIDALPVFLYAEIVGSKEPFDCAVCLCEFAQEDKLRLLPLCGHAFHVDCIDTWLLSNSTCPLCRGALFLQGLTVENPMFDFEDLREEERSPAGTGVDGDAALGEKKVFPVRLGKFKKMGVGREGNNNAGGGTVMREEGESSSSSLDARRCFSMGSYQYVVADANLQVALSSVSRKDGAEKGNGHSTNGEAVEGKRLGPASRRESFSMSKVWQWPNNKGKLPMSSDTSLHGGLQI